MQRADTTSGLRILIVEDLHDSADSLAILVRLWGHDVLVVYDGLSALEAGLANPPDVVLLDIGLPKMNGYDLARRFREAPATAEALLVAITGYGREIDVQRCKEAGIDHHFLKPVDPAELQQVLAKAAQRGHEHPQLAG